MNRVFACIVAGAVVGSAGARAGSEDDIKAMFERFVVAQNARDLAAVRDLLLDSPDFLWITPRAEPIWGREAAMKRFEKLYQGTWKLNPDRAGLRVLLLSDSSAQVFVPITFNSGPAGQPPTDSVALVNQILVKTPAGWRVASILPIPVPRAAATPQK
jgi:ketosteroid isomerase-like protein